MWVKFQSGPLPVNTQRHSSVPYARPDSVKNGVLQAVNEKRNIVKRKGKGKFHPLTGHEGP